jgi:hypothetical protein
VIQAKPYDDPVEIRPESSGWAIALSGFKNPQKRFLRDIFGGLMTAQHPMCRPPSRLLMA